MSDEPRLIQTAKEAIAQGDYAYAVTILRDVIGFSPESWEAYMLLGACLGRLGRTTEGVRALKQAVWLNPRSVQVHYNLGKVLYQAGELNEAADHLEKALAIDQHYEKAFTLLLEIRSLLRPKAQGWGVSTPPPPRAVENKRGVPQSRKSSRGVLVALFIIAAVCAGVCLPIIIKRVEQKKTTAPAVPVATTKPGTKKWSGYAPEPRKKPHKVVKIQPKAGTGTGNNFAGQNAAGKDFSAQDLEGANFAGAVLTGANFSGANLERACFSGANLQHCNLAEAHLLGADLRDSDLHGKAWDGGDPDGADLTSANLKNADLRGADLRGVSFENADLSNADLTNADLRGAYFADCNLSGAIFTGADLNDAVMDFANVDGADFSRAQNLRGAQRNGMKGTSSAQWPEGFDPDK